MTNGQTTVDLTPIGDRVLVELEEGGMTQGGLHVPGNAQNVLETGLVVAVGPGRMLDNGSYAHPGVNVGDRIMFGMRTGGQSALEVRLGSTTYFLISHTLIVGVFAAGAARPVTPSLLVS